MSTPGNAPQFDVLIIGAGAAGLMAACELSKAGRKVIVAEAATRVGGRMFTVNDARFNQPVELGAEFVHGNLPITKELLAAAGIALQPSNGSVWEKQGARFTRQEELGPDETQLAQSFAVIEQDLPLSEFLASHVANEEQRRSLQQYVEGYYAADPERTSTLAVKEELEQPEEPQYRPAGGYRGLADFLYHRCQEQGVAFLLGTPVTQLHWREGGAEAVTFIQNIRAAKVLTTVSIGVLQREGITFIPALPQKTAAARALGFGHAIKVVVQCTHAFWKQRQYTAGQDLADLNFLFADATLPTWWTHHPVDNAVLTGWIAGPQARALAFLSPQDWEAKVKEALAAIFGLEASAIAPLIKGVRTFNWSGDPFFNGAYSYDVVNGQQLIGTLLEPVADTLYFAGEGLHTGPEIGTVEAALASGREAAVRILAARS